MSVQIVWHFKMYCILQRTMKVCVLVNSNTGFCSREISGLMMIDRHVGIMNLLLVR